MYCRGRVRRRIRVAVFWYLYLRVVTSLEDLSSALHMRCRGMFRRILGTETCTITRVRIREKRKRGPALVYIASCKPQVSEIFLYVNNTRIIDTSDSAE